MDERLEKALDVAKLRHSQYLEKRRLEEKLQSDLTFYHSGGCFYIDSNLLGFLSLLTPEEGQASVIILDQHLKPIRVADLVAFRRDVLNTYTSVVNQYYIDYEKFRRNRSVQSVVNL